MDRRTAGKLLEENLHTIFAWSVSRLYDKSEAEDLTQDIICAVLKSVNRLEKDEAFFGFMWKIAENTLCARLRKKRPDTAELNEKNCGAYIITPEDDFISSEDIQLLRRELSLLSSQYRESTVLYYIYGKSCSEISSELNISVEMVKYYLFKTRKILKEGIGMTREFGEKSYAPQTFRLDYWGEYSTPYYDLFERRLPGNIVLSAYDKPVTITELSIELGVAAVYLEDEIKILERYELLKRIGDKYQTNIIIFTDEYEKRTVKKIKPIYEKSAVIFNSLLEEAMPKLKGVNFFGNNYDSNRLKWTFANLAMYCALNTFDDPVREKFGDYPLLSNGSYGFVFGYDNDYKNHHFNGIYGYCANAEGTSWISVENYRIIQRCQLWEANNYEKAVRAMNDAVLGKKADKNNDEIIRMINEGYISSDNGILSPCFPVFTSEVFEHIKEMLIPLTDEVCGCMEKICGIAADTLKDYVPKALKDKCGQLAYIHYHMNVMAFIIEEMVKNGQLIVPDERVNLCIFGIDRREKLC